MPDSRAPAETHVWCWTCGQRRDGEDRYLHRADNPVLKHDRCAVCNDLLLPWPVGERDELATLLRQATWRYSGGTREMYEAQAGAMLAAGYRKRGNGDVDG